VSQVEARQIQCSSNSNVGQRVTYCVKYVKNIFFHQPSCKKKKLKPLYERSYHACYLVTSSIFSQEVTQTPLLVVPKKFLALHAEELRGIRLSSEWRYAILRRRKIQELKSYCIRSYQPGTPGFIYSASACVTSG
jgi:hypothetical protein